MVSDVIKYLKQSQRERVTWVSKLRVAVLLLHSGFLLSKKCTVGCSPARPCGFVYIALYCISFFLGRLKSGEIF